MAKSDVTALEPELHHTTKSVVVLVKHAMLYRVLTWAEVCLNHRSVLIDGALPGMCLRQAVRE